jgi:hypothetical protein
MAPRHKCFDMVIVTLRQESNSKVGGAYPNMRTKRLANMQALVQTRMSCHLHLVKHVVVWTKVGKEKMR